MKELGPGSYKSDVESSCPVCGTLLNAFTNMQNHCGEEGQPSPGDVSICYKCTSYIKVEENFTLSELSVDELVDLPNETLYELTEARNRLKKYNKEHANKFKPYVPKYIDTSDMNLDEIPFQDTNDLLKIEHIQRFAKHPSFTKFALSEDILMALLDEGKKWLVVGFIRDPSKVDLPHWKHPKEE